ncbi:MAG: hypothetical protein EOQ50_31990 [Mesorhizobium sp.]|uniref:hypothetical protein n=1 Tax=Mesorhizobium sp. TaxID=1871066 RepID=UPI000FE94C0F|nr:hypothetical protein [Mesorhizobium sp.]RWB66650.1 MAG: hypothetical protein EOQ50_31990 [Mesorhizobium sp.]
MSRPTWRWRQPADFARISPRLRRGFTISGRVPATFFLAVDQGQLEHGDNAMTTLVPFIGLSAVRPSHASPSGHFRLLAAVTAALLWLPRFWRARSDLAALAAMSECERRDIGLTAFDIENAIALPFDRDPTEVLARVVDDRRHRRES